MESLFANLSLSTEEEEELVFESSDIQTPDQNSEFCLVGRFLTDRLINFNIMRNRLAEIWRPVRGMAVKEIRPNIYLFQFFHSMDLSRIMDGGPWTFDNFLLIHQKLQPGEVPTNVPLYFVNFWIQVHDLPMGFMSQSVGKQLGDFVGRFIEYDDKNNSSFWRSYMRIRVNVDVRKPLKIFKKIKKARGEFSIVNFKYEKLSIFCFYCGILGHSDKFCDLLFEATNSNPTKEWGTWLRATPRRSAATGGERWLRDEDGDGNSKNTTEGNGDFLKDGRDHRRNQGISKDLIPHQSGTQMVVANSNINSNNKEINAPKIIGNQVEEHIELTIHDDKKRRRDGLRPEAQVKIMDLDSSHESQDELDKLPNHPKIQCDHFLTAGLEHQARRER
ncbi:uncharacterized protein LOC142546988 [Primulina tabacum]|uniref:uncharacterized protein LOC142546988 n=1 Tax=Primulina tabacum TaxID=48773 RepID=UPI003F59300A